VDRDPRAESIRKFDVPRSVTESSVVKETASNVCSIGCGERHWLVTNVPVRRDAERQREKTLFLRASRQLGKLLWKSQIKKKNKSLLM